jgi:predicted nucleic acid-binding protein
MPAAESVLVDAGPLLAWLNRRDEHHEWASGQLARLRPPLLTCEPVLAELAYHLLALGDDPAKALELIASGMVQVALCLEDETEALASLLRRYSNVPMSLADACMVRLSELHERSVVFTVDTDFRIYRRNGRLVIPTLLPPQR